MRTKLYAILFTVLTVVSFIFMDRIRGFEFLFLGISIILSLISIFWVYKYFKDDSFKNLTSWLKGGVIGAIFATILSIILILFGEYDGVFTVFLALFVIFSNFLSGIFTGKCNVETCFKVINIYLYLALYVIQFFILGAIIGWIVGKVKSRRTQSNQI